MYCYIPRHIIDVADLQKSNHQYVKLLLYTMQWNKINLNVMSCNLRWNTHSSIGNEDGRRIVIKIILACSFQI